LGLLRRKKFADEPLFLLVFDAGEEFLSQLRNGLWPIKGQAVIDLASLKMARLTSCLKYWLNLGCKIWFFAVSATERIAKSCELVVNFSNFAR